MNNKKFSVGDCGSVELCVGGSVDVLKRVQGEGWVVERKILSMMAFISEEKKPEAFGSLLQLEVERPEWGGVLLSLFDVSEAQTH